ncbi:MAG: hypothetical protein ACRDOO_25605 [Actinomadura sp.]
MTGHMRWRDVRAEHVERSDGEEAVEVLTVRIDEAITFIGPDDSGEAAVTTGQRLLAQGDDW